jgi:hypothetical protein
MEHQQQATQHEVQPIKQPTAYEMISILHQHQVLDHYENIDRVRMNKQGRLVKRGKELVDQYVQIQINDQQDYRDSPKIQLEYEGGCIWCWEPDEDREIWTFTYASNEGDNEILEREWIHNAVHGKTRNSKENFKYE